jgi:DNA helicase-2/ATP-dependent DNA helicase PcrA
MKPPVPAVKPAQSRPAQPVAKQTKKEPPKQMSLALGSTSTMVWSKHQEIVFADFRSGTGNLAIDAVPGSGKSTTLIEGLKHLPPKETDVMMTSFSVQSVEDLKKKDAPWFVDIRTMNSLGNLAITKRFGKQGINRDRVYSILDKVLGERPEDPVMRGQFNGFRMRIKALVDMGKSYLVEDLNGLLEVADSHEIDLTTPDWIAVELAKRWTVSQKDVLLESARRALQLCKEVDGNIDFNDQIWLPYVHKLELQTFHLVIVDEAQDTTLAQMDLLIRSCAPGGRIIMAGENAQAIYAWRGAGLGMGPFIKRTNAKVLPLSISYRCPKAVVREAEKVVPGIQAAPDASEGSVSTIVADLLPRALHAGDTVLSRKNAPLIALFMRLLAAGIPVTMQGRDLGEKLLRFIVKSAAKSADELLAYTKKWADEEIEHRMKRNPKARLDQIEDHVKCIEELCASGVDIDEVVQSTRKLLTATEGGAVLLSTVHRAKGLEWNKVFLLHDSFPVNWTYWMKYAKKNNARTWAESRAQRVRTEEIEERNLLYVATTRAKKELVYVMPIENSPEPE